jgi:hypothetical protein
MIRHSLKLVCIRPESSALIERDQCTSCCTWEGSPKEMRMTRTLKVSRFALAAFAGTCCLLINDNMSSTKQSSLISQSDARVGRPGTPGSVAGVARRTDRRATRRGAVGAAGVGAAAVGAAAVGAAAVGAAAVGAASDYGSGGYYGSGYYGGPGYYGAYGSPYGSYAGSYGAYGSGSGAYAAPASTAPASAAPAATSAYAASGSDSPNYGPGPVPGSFIVNPNTGRWCTYQDNGYRWCWTP